MFGRKKSLPAGRLKAKSRRWLWSLVAVAILSLIVFLVINFWPTTEEELVNLPEPETPDCQTEKEKASAECAILAYDYYPAGDIAFYNSPDQCWVGINGFIYNLSRGIWDKPDEIPDHFYSDYCGNHNLGYWFAANDYELPNNQLIVGQIDD